MLLNGPNIDFDIWLNILFDGLQQYVQKPAWFF